MLPLLAHADTDSPSFDCKKATTSTDQVICKDSDLPYYDSAMTKYYEIAKKNLSPQQQKALLIEQRTWLKNRKKVCQIPEKINFDKDNWDNLISPWLATVVEGKV